MRLISWTISPIVLISLLFPYFDESLYIMTTLKYLTEVPQNWLRVRILTANVGNLDLNCGGRYNNKLCQKSVEEAISRNILHLQPNIVFLQELMHPSQCYDWAEMDTNKACFEANSNFEQNQARRLLGKDYTILCAARMRSKTGHAVGMECIAIQTNVGTINGCPPGELCFASEGLDIVGEKCNPEFVIMSALAEVHSLKIRLINAHPHSRDKNCRDNALRQIFESQARIPVLGAENNIIIAGDFNFDPFQHDRSVPEIWQKYVGLFGSGKPYYYHSGLAEHDPPYPTAHFLYKKKTIDHVISNFAAGICITLGEAPRTERIDGGKGMDHRAILCDMWIPPSNLPS